MPLLYVFNRKSTVNLILDLLQIPYNTRIQLVLFGITNMHTNILIKDFLDVIKLMCSEKILTSN